MDGSIQSGAAKTMPYESPEEQAKANAELAGLRDAEGCPYLGQCLAVFKHVNPNDKKHYLCMVLE